jgi:uncharacterized coiled-coil protein SlyX
MEETSQSQSGPQSGRQPGRSTFENFGRKVDARVGNFGPRIEDEVRRVITYLNDQVVPQVRQNSSSALRAASEQLGRLADYLEQQRTATQEQQRRTPPPGQGEGDQRSA